MKLVKLWQLDCVVEKTQYPNGTTALILNDAHTGEEITVATVNMPGVKCGRNEVYIKDYSENEGVLKALQDAGVVRPTGEVIQRGFAAIPNANCSFPTGS